jgi:PhnB protein
MMKSRFTESQIVAILKEREAGVAPSDPTKKHMRPMPLERKTMGSYKPEGWATITPRLFTHDVQGLVDFLKQVFDAKGEVHTGRPTEITIEDSRIMISDGGGVRAASAAFLYVYVPDIDETHRRAIEAGAQTIEAPSSTPYGDRRATVQDRWGNTWQIATRSTRT